MKKIFFALILILSNASVAQNRFDDWEKASKQSDLLKKNILIILTGAEWCKPCIKMEKNVLSTTDFIEYANQNLILFEINLPRHQDYSTKVVKDYNFFKNKYQTNTLPCMILVNNKGEEITRISKGLDSLEKVMGQLKIHQ